MSMVQKVIQLSVVLTLAGWAATAGAQQGQQGQTGQGYSTPMMGPGMMMYGPMMGPGMMPGMGPGSMMGMGPMMGGPGQHIEGRIAFLRTELKINNTQAQLFDTYADTLRAAASSMQGMHNQMWSGSMPTTLPERLERQEQMMTACLDALKKIRAAAVPLYNALSPEQKQSADTLMGMMGGLW